MIFVQLRFRVSWRGALKGIASSPVLLNHATPRAGIAAGSRRSPFVV